jgi:hypothetical protein
MDTATPIVTTLVLASIVLPFSASALAQTAGGTKVDMHAPAPRLSNGKPDFSGVWARPSARDMTESATNANGTSKKGEPNPLPFTPWGQAQWDAYNPVKNGDFAGSCMPFGWIRSFHPHPMQIVQNNEWITFLFEQSTMFQVVNTEGLPHRKDWPPTWFGDSRGHWEGDTLVIDVVNFNGHATLGTIGHPASDQAHLVMRFTRPDLGHMTFEWVLEDPKTYTRPIRNERVFVLTPNVEVMEYACMENNMASLLSGAITPWTGPTVAATDVVPDRWQWTSFDLTRSQTYSGVVREMKWEFPLATAKIEVAGKTWDVVLAPPVRMDFRGLVQEDIQPGTAVTFQAVPSRQNPNELRAETVTIGKTTTELR